MGACCSVRALEFCGSDDRDSIELPANRTRGVRGRASRPPPPRPIISYPNDDRNSIELPPRDNTGRYTDPPPRVPSPPSSSEATLDEERRVVEEGSVAPLGGLNYSTHRRRPPPEHGVTSARPTMAVVPGNPNIGPRTDQDPDSPDSTARRQRVFGGNPNVTPRSHQRARTTLGGSPGEQVGLGIRSERTRQSTHVPSPYDGPASTVRRVSSPSLENSFQFGFPQPEQKAEESSSSSETGLTQIRSDDTGPRASFMEPTPGPGPGPATPTPAQRAKSTSASASDRSQLPSERRRNEANEQGLRIDTETRGEVLQRSSTRSRRRLPTPTTSPRPVSEGFILSTPRSASTGKRVSFARE